MNELFKEIALVPDVMKSEGATLIEKGSWKYLIKYLDVISNLSSAELLLELNKEFDSLREKMDRLELR